MGPLIVCGTGGSGTRAIADYLIGGGLFMGAALNESLDSLPFAGVLDGFTADWLAVENGDSRSFSTAEFLRAWAEAEAGHLRGHMGEEGWGTKNPGMILLMDLVYDVIPEVCFLHVVRDGIEMAFSSNRRQLVLYGDRILGPAGARETREKRALRLWARVNTRAAEEGGRHPGRYAVVRYEDFCAAPGREMRRVSCDLGLSIDHDAAAGRSYQRSSRQVSGAQRAAIGGAVGEVGPALAAFGY